MASVKLVYGEHSHDGGFRSEEHNVSFDAEGTRVYDSDHGLEVCISVDGNPPDKRREMVSRFKEQDRSRFEGKRSVVLSLNLPETKRLMEQLSNALYDAKRAAVILKEEEQYRDEMMESAAALAIEEVAAEKYREEMAEAEEDNEE